MRLVSDIGELELIRRIAERLEAPPPGEVWAGDDTAVLRPAPEHELFTTDLMVEGVDFELSYCTGGDVGYKALAVNVSDVAAMGGVPRHALITMGLRAETTLAIVDGIVEGLAGAAKDYGVALVGGDVSQAGELSLGVAMTGAAQRPVLRRGARPGDALVVTGRLGGAAGGLAVLRRGARLATGHAAALVRRQLRPEPRLAAGGILASYGATAMIDLSDGLAVDLGHLCSSSGAGCVVETAAIPVDESLEAMAKDLDLDPLQTALTGGEDFELLAALPPDAVSRAEREVRAAGVALTEIGRVTEGGCYIGDKALDEIRREGWEHLRSR